MIDILRQGLLKELTLEKIHQKKILEKDVALKNGYNEAVFLNTDENISEGTYTNVFFVKDNIIYTPLISCGILPGIMREKVIELINLLSLELKFGAYLKKIY